MRKVATLLFCGAMIAVSGCGSAGADNAAGSSIGDHAATAQRSAPNPKKSVAVVTLATDTPEPGRCYEDSCSWSITKNRTVVRQDPNGILVRLSLLGGTSANTDEDPAKARIQWDTNPHDVYVFCSTRLPAVMIRNDVPAELVKAEPGHHFPPYQIDVLDFVNGVPGALESSANLFVRTCYPGDDWTASDFAQRRGLPAFDDLPDITIDKPEDVFQAASSVQQH